MRIALFTDTFFPQVNGVVNVVHHLAVALAKRGHAVGVFTVSRESGEALEQRLGLRYRVFTIPSMPIPMYPGERLTLPVGLSIRKVRAFRPDVIHVHTPFAMGREAYLSARRFNIPLVGTHHTFFDHYLKLWRLDYPWARAASWKLTNRFYNRVAAFISPTQALISAMQRYGLSSAAEVIPNPVPLADFRPIEVASRGEGDRTTSLAYMGRLSDEKDIDMVLEAYAQVLASERFRAEPHPTRLMIIGDGPHAGALKRRAAELGVDDTTTFTGFLRGAALSEAVRGHTLFVTASKSENMPVSVLEAMASGLPIVAVSALGMPEIVRHRENGFLAQPDDTQSMASYMLDIMYDAELQKKFAAASRSFALLHEPDRIAERHEEVYRRVCEALKNI